MSISELRELLGVLTEFGVTHYKSGDLTLVIERPATDEGETTNAIGFAVDGPSDDEPEDPFAKLAEKLRGKLPAEYFDPRLGLIR